MKKKVLIKYFLALLLMSLLWTYIRQNKSYIWTDYNDERIFKGTKYTDQAIFIKDSLSRAGHKDLYDEVIAGQMELESTEELYVDGFVFRYLYYGLPVLFIILVISALIHYFKLNGFFYRLYKGTANNVKTRNELKILLAQNMEKTIDKLKNIIQNPLIDKYFKDDVVFQASRLNDLKNEIDKDGNDKEFADIKRNKIRIAINNIIDNLATQPELSFRNQLYFLFKFRILKQISDFFQKSKRINKK
jgi:hypothetical protein